MGMRAADIIEDTESEAEEVGPPGSVCPPGWQSRRLRCRRQSDPRREEAIKIKEEEGEVQCGICKEFPLQEVKSRCGGVKCSFETCNGCWVSWLEVSPYSNCPACKRVCKTESEDEAEDSDY